MKTKIENKTINDHPEKYPTEIDFILTSKKIIDAHKTERRNALKNFIIYYIIV